ncbi:phage holin family protein [Micromonospora sp. CPCC 206061]|uniref:phage holin family protein n=1 Tax=Micromonospora sp. CPCC 206061 TaxID=3122410 RepID=UPI002FEF43DB
MGDVTRAGSADPGQASTAELVRDAAEQISRLVRDELALAKAEMTEKGKRAGIGAGLFGGGGLIALYGVAGLLTTVVLALAEAMPAWLAALIVTVVLFAVAAVLALLGRRHVQQATPPVPEQAIDSVKADIEQVKERAHR